MELVGRKREQGQLAALVATAPLITITGAGGVGKTALATALIADARVLPDGGAAFVDLTAVDHPDGLRELVASSLGTSDFSSLCRSQLCRDTLLVLDNCEHVLEAAADAVGELLNMHAPPTIVVTSRVVLDIPNETIVPVLPLSLSVELDRSKSDTTEADAVQLLVRRASTQGVKLEGADLGYAASICDKLDGLPLAIEIAAARLRSRSAMELDQDLAAGLHELARPRFRGEGRHRSVREMVLWSVELLEEELAEHLTTLSVFAGPFTVEMASKLTGLSNAITRDRLDELVAASLVSADTKNQKTWYRFLSPVRSVLLHEIATADQLTELRSRWVDVILQLAFDTTVPGSDGWTDATLDGLLALYPNVAEALRWLRDNDSEPRRALKLVSVLWGVVHQRHVAEVASLGEFVIDQPGAREDRNWPNAAATVATCAVLLGDHERVSELAEDALKDATNLGFAHVALLRARALAARSLGHRQSAVDFFQKAEQAAVSGEHHGLELEIKCDLGYLMTRLGDVEGGLIKIDGAYEQALATGASVNTAWAHVCKGIVALETSPTEALPILREALAKAHEINYLAGISTATRAIALAQLQRKDYRAASESLGALLDHFEYRGELGDLRMALDIAGVLANQVGDTNWADLIVTAASLPVTSATVDPKPPMLDQALATNGRVLEAPAAFTQCRVVIQTVFASNPPSADLPLEYKPSRAASDTARAPLVGELLRRGPNWSVTFDGESATVADSKGLHDLVALVTVPYREIAAYDLMGSKVIDPATQQVIDTRTRGELEQAIRDLQQELDEAQLHNDQARAEQLQQEFDRLVQYLGTALGLGGKHRTVSASAERARSAVTHRVRAQIRKLEPTHPALAAHFRASIRTGVFCSYQPERETLWNVHASPTQPTPDEHL